MRTQILVGSFVIISALPAAAFDPAKLDTLTMGLSRESVTEFLGPPDESSEHRFPLHRYEFVYRYIEASKPAQALLVFGSEGKLSYFTYVPARPALARAFDPRKLETLGFGLTEARTREFLGVPDQIERALPDSDNFTYRYVISGGDLREAKVFFYDGQLSQYRYRPIASKAIQPFPSATIRRIRFGLAEKDVIALLGTPTTATPATTVDMLTYSYAMASGEKRELQLFFGPDHLLRSFVIVAPADENRYRQDFDLGKLRSITIGMTLADVKAVLGVPTDESHFRHLRAPGGELVYDYAVLKPENHLVRFRFGADGRLTDFRTEPMPQAGVAYDGDEPAALKKLTPGASMDDVRRLVGEPEWEEHSKDGSAAFHYSYHIPPGPDGGQSLDFEAVVSFGPDGRFRKVGYRGQGAAALGLPGL